MSTFITRLALAGLLVGVALGWGSAAMLEELATKSGKTENRAPAWAKRGTLVYRICTPDEANLLPNIEAGVAVTSNLLDGSVGQITMLNGIIGHDHPGPWNWDGAWPYWDRVTFRAKDWNTLSGFMQRLKDQHNTQVSFHVNLTDVNAGLRDYPETRAFFEKLVATKSIYRRDYNPATRKYEIGEPYIMQQIPAEEQNPVKIVSLVNYKNFWDSGLAKEMIDAFYARLPYAPPILYLDVLTLSGGNFSTGYPDGALGGSRETQLAGMQAIAEYLHSKGTDLATEGDRTSLVGERGSYVWLHGGGGSRDDYSIISGAPKGSSVVTMHVAGNTGCFDVSPIACTPAQLGKVRAHYARLLAGKPGIRPLPDTSTWHIADRSAISDEFDIPGSSDRFRGDWIDLVNNFYLTGIQEQYHIGKGNMRTHTFNKIGVLHVGKFVLTDAQGAETIIPVADCLPSSASEEYRTRVKAAGRLMMESPLSTRFHAPRAGAYRLTLYGGIPVRSSGAMNVYVNGQLQQTATSITFPTTQQIHPFELGEITLREGENELLFDSGPLFMKWSDGTTATWTTPALGTGFTVTNGDVTFAQDYDRMWPDSWSGQKKIYFYSWDGTARAWKLPQEWAEIPRATLYPLTPTGRGPGKPLAIQDRTVTPKLLPQVPYVLVPEGK